MVSNMYAHIFKEDIVEQGHKLSVVNIGDVSLFFQDHNPVPQMERLRDELDRQIEAIKAERFKPVAAPADPEPIQVDMELPGPLPDPLPHVELLEGDVIPMSTQHDPGCLCLDCIPF